MQVRYPVLKTVHGITWVRPAGNTDYRITQGFTLGVHDGLDLSDNACGSTLVASADGTVRFAQTIAGGASNGEIIVAIDHGGGWWTVYGHLSRRVVNVGNVVSKGQKIGEIGATGIATGCHVHWGLKSGVASDPYNAADGTWKNPLNYLPSNSITDPNPPAEVDDPTLDYWTLSASQTRVLAASSDTVRRIKTDATTHDGCGKSKHLYVGRQGSFDYDSFIKFALDWTSVGRIVRATLNLYTDEYNAIGPAGEIGIMPAPGASDHPSVYIYRLLSAFVEGTNVDGNFDSSDYVNPTHTTTGATSRVLLPAGADLLHAIDITAIVKAWAPSTVAGGGRAANHGIVLDGVQDSTKNWSGWSREHIGGGGASERPTITLVYEYGATVPNTPANLVPSGTVPSVDTFEGDFSDIRSSDQLQSTSIEIYDAGQAATVDAATNVITDTGGVKHGLVAGDQVYFTAVSTVPELVPFQRYYVKATQLTATGFTVSPTNGGTTVNITTNGTATWSRQVGALSKIASESERTAAHFIVPRSVTLGIIATRTYRWRARVTDQEGQISPWTSLVSFVMSNTPPNPPTLSPVSGSSYPSLNLVKFKGGTFSDIDNGTVLMEDLFPGTSLDPRWASNFHPSGLPHAQADPSLATVSGGYLRLKAEKRGSLWYSCSVDTKLSFTRKYGLFEARIQIPKGKGFWPAGPWSYVSPPGQEIDGMEIYAAPIGLGIDADHDVSVLHCNVHWTGVAGDDTPKVIHTGVDLSLAFHTYAFSYQADYLVWYLDGVEVHRVANRGITLAMPFILDFGIGGSGGQPDGTTPTSAEMLVDWVRVTDTGSDHLEAHQVQLSPFPQGDVRWDEADGILWDSGKRFDPSGATSWEEMYGGPALPAGTYYWRARQWDTRDGVSTWTYAQIILTADFSPDPGSYSAVQINPQAPWRILIRDLYLADGVTKTAGRGPGRLVAVFEEAKNVGASIVYNSPGEMHFTLLKDDPQLSVVEPKQVHYAVEFYSGDGWQEKFAGVVWDVDATETDVVFKGIDYLALYDTVVDERYDPLKPNKTYTAGGSFYSNVTIQTVVTDQLNRAKGLTDSWVGFIAIGAIAAMGELVTVYSTMTSCLSFVAGLVDSHRQGTGKRTRVKVVKTTTGTYQLQIVDDPGLIRSDLAMYYGELVQGYRIIVFGDGWANVQHIVGRNREGAKVVYQTVSGQPFQPATSLYGRIATVAVMDGVQDQNDLKRRGLQAAIQSAKLGKNVAIGIRTQFLAPFQGWDVCDVFPLKIDDGAINTDNFGSGFWAAYAGAWEATDIGEQSLVITFLPREDATAPDVNLIPSRPISTQAEWQLGWQPPDPLLPHQVYLSLDIGEHMDDSLFMDSLTTKTNRVYHMDVTTGVVSVQEDDGTWTPITAPPTPTRPAGVLVASRQTLNKDGTAVANISVMVP